MGFGPCKDPECKAPILSAGGGAGHRSDCAVHNAPAYPAGHCDCGFVATEGGAPPVDELAQIIRTVDGDHSLGAGELAERILTALAQKGDSYE
jgi:hypothetical protein